MNAGRGESVKPQKTDIAKAICARDWKGVGKDISNTVVIYEKSEGKKCDK